MGIEVVEAEVYDKKSKDLSAVVAKIKANKDVQAVVNWSIVPAQAIVAKNMRQGRGYFTSGKGDGFWFRSDPERQYRSARGGDQIFRLC